jgi:hypothetical protein
MKRGKIDPETKLVAVLEGLSLAYWLKDSGYSVTAMTPTTTATCTRSGL